MPLSLCGNFNDPNMILLFSLMDFGGKSGAKVTHLFIGWLKQNPIKRWAMERNCSLGGATITFPTNTKILLQVQAPPYDSLFSP